MSLHYGFSDSGDDDAESGPYECSDADHCDNGVECLGEHNYSEQYYRRLWGIYDSSQSINKSVDKSVDKSVEKSVDKSVEKSVDKSVEKSVAQSVSSVDKPMNETLSDAIKLDEPFLVSSVCPNHVDLPDDDDGYVSDSEDACSCS